MPSRESEPKHKRITPLRALDLLRTLGSNGTTPSAWGLDAVRDALAQHISAELTRKRRRP